MSDLRALAMTLTAESEALLAEKHWAMHSPLRGCVEPCSYRARLAAIEAAARADAEAEVARLRTALTEALGGWSAADLMVHQDRGYDSLDSTDQPQRPVRLPSDAAMTLTERALWRRIDDTARWRAFADDFAQPAAPAEPG